MSKITKKHDKGSSENKAIEKLATYYDNTDATEDGDLKKLKVIKPELHKINIMIPEHVYQEAKRMGHEAGIGYQSILKMAIAKGLKQLTF